MKKLLLLLLFSYLFIGVKAGGELEVKDQVFPTSPEAAALTKYINKPIGNFTGTTNIEIPLYQVEGRNIGLPMSLSYHPSGIKVAEEASWVGLGWALNAGGLITRTVQGLPDDVEGGYLHNSLDKDNLSFEDYLDIDTKQLDALPDIYQFNFAGYKGTFSISKETKGKYTIYDAHVTPHQNIDIQLRFDKNSELDEFIFTVENGAKYIFNYKEISIDGIYTQKGNWGDIVSEETSWENEYVIPDHTISWYLSEIIAPNNNFENIGPFDDRITFFYEKGGDIEQSLKMNEYITTPTGFECHALYHSKAHIYSYLDRTITPVYLKSIYSLANKSLVEFKTVDRSDLIGAKQLTNINISVNGQALKSFDLISESVVGDNCNDQRMYLKTLAETGLSTTNNPYLFTYNNESGLPCKDSYQYDHWGYFNGATENDNLFGTGSSIPEWIDEQSDGANRSVDENYNFYGSLATITHPTMGVTSYSYGANIVNVSDEGGGIRVESILETSGVNGSVINTLFEYSGGVLYDEKQDSDYKSTTYFDVYGHMNGSPFY